MAYLLLPKHRTTMQRQQPAARVASVHTLKARCPRSDEEHSTACTPSLSLRCWPDPMVRCLLAMKAKAVMTDALPTGEPP